MSYDISFGSLPSRCLEMIASISFVYSLSPENTFFCLKRLISSPIQLELFYISKQLVEPFEKQINNSGVKNSIVKLALLEMGKRFNYLYFQQLGLRMSKKKIEQIPCQIVNKEACKVNLRKTLINSKFNWLMKYISKENQDSIENQDYLMTSIKMRPQARQYTRKSVLKQNREILNKSHGDVKPNRKHQGKQTLEHKYSHIRSRIFTENIENGSKTKKGRNTSLLLSSNNPKQTFNFIEYDTRRLGHQLKTDLQLYKRRYKKKAMRTQQEQFNLTPWNLDQQANKENAAIEAQFQLF